jgi:TonB family protein
MPGEFRASRWKLAVTAFFLLGLGAQAALSQGKAQEATPMGVELPHRVGDDVTRPEKISGAPPVYTEAARKARVQGVVIVEAIIDEQGNVTQTNILKGLPLGLSQAAVEAVKAWKFKPAMFEGRPVKVYYTLTVNFKAEGPPTYGPLFRKFLEENTDFAKFLATRQYQDAAQLLDRQATERPDSSAEISLARCYLLLEQGRLKEAWQVAQSYRGSEQFELPYVVGLFAARKAAAEKLLSLEARTEIIELGLQAETRAMEVRKDALAPVVYKGQLLGEKMKLTTDPKEREALSAEIAQLMGLARELRVRGEVPDPFASETN